MHYGSTRAAVQEEEASDTPWGGGYKNTICGFRYTRPQMQEQEEVGTKSKYTRLQMQEEEEAADLRGVRPGVRSPFWSTAAAAACARRPGGVPDAARAAVRRGGRAEAAFGVDLFVLRPAALPPPRPAPVLARFRLGVSGVATTSAGLSSPEGTGVAAAEPGPSVASGAAGAALPRCRSMRERSAAGRTLMARGSCGGGHEGQVSTPPDTRQQPRGVWASCPCVCG